MVKAQSHLESLISIKFPAGAKTASFNQARGNPCRSSIKGDLIALVPKDNVVTTVLNNFNFFMYVPKHELKSAEFEITDKSGKSIYYLTDLNISDTSGMIQLIVPENISLETNKEYTWIFAMICDPWDRTSDIFVEGTIKKIEISSDLENKLQNATPIEQVQLYKNAGIWNEAISLVAELRESNPQEWEELLESVGLEKFASEPFVPCCELK